MDLPGYGFARVSQAEKERWGNMIETFLTTYPNLMGIVMLIDIRHMPSAHDRSMLDWIRHFNFPMIIVATKADKLGKTRIKPQIDKIRKELGISAKIPILPFSSQTSLGKETLLKHFDLLLKNPLDFQG